MQFLIHRYLFHLQQRSHFVVNVCVVVVAFKAVAAYTLREYWNWQASMGIGGKVDAGFIIQDMGNGYAERFVAAV